MSDLLLKVLRTRTAGDQRTYMCGTAVLWNAFKAVVVMGHLAGEGWHPHLATLVPTLTVSL